MRGKKRDWSTCAPARSSRSPSEPPSSCSSSTQPVAEALEGLIDLECIPRGWVFVGHDNCAGCRFSKNPWTDAGDALLRYSLLCRARAPTARGRAREAEGQQWSARHECVYCRGRPLKSLNSQSCAGREGVEQGLSWNAIADLFPDRTGKQIRERWHNQVPPSPHMSPTPQLLLCAGAFRIYFDTAR